MVYCWHDSHQILKASGKAFSCRSPAHKKNRACDSECPEHPGGGIHCCSDVDHGGICIGPNGPGWEHPKDCPCKDWPGSAPLPKEQTLLPGQKTLQGG